MNVRNLSTHDKEIPGVGSVAAGESIEVPDEVGAGLCEQTDAWAAVTTKTKKES